MVVETHGWIDFEEGRFTARFDDDPTIVEMFETIQRCHWLRAKAAWVVEAHWPSVSRLFRIALHLNFEISAQAWDEKGRVQSDGEAAEYSLDMIHDNHGSARFRCLVGDDDEVRDRVRAIPGSYWEDEYWSVPTDWEHCCEPLREIVLHDTRFILSPAAELLLLEPDVSHLYVRSAPRLMAADVHHPSARFGAGELPELPPKEKRQVSIELADRHEYELVVRKTQDRLHALEREYANAFADPTTHAARARALRKDKLGAIQVVLHECGRQKVAGIVQWIEQWFREGDEPLVVFAYHRDVIAQLESRFPDAASITGEDALVQRDQTVRDFQEGKTHLMLCSPGAGSD
jgi:hypothetical protein